jgi:hypothetical protein
VFVVKYGFVKKLWGGLENPGSLVEKELRMRPVKTKPRFKCDFCTKVLTFAAMERHEKICWKNPNRYCELCKNEGVITEYFEGYGGVEHPCYFCEKYDPWPKDDYNRRDIALMGGDIGL